MYSEDWLDAMRHVVRPETSVNGGSTDAPHGHMPGYCRLCVRAHSTDSPALLHEAANTWAVRRVFPCKVAIPQPSKARVARRREIAAHLNVFALASHPPSLLPAPLSLSLSTNLINALSRVVTA